MIVEVKEDEVQFPTLAQLNAEIFEREDGEEELSMSDDSFCSKIEVFVITCSQAIAAKRGHPPPFEPPQASRVPNIGPLTANILACNDKLFYVFQYTPGSDPAEWALLRFNL